MNPSYAADFFSKKGRMSKGRDQAGMNTAWIPAWHTLNTSCFAGKLHGEAHR